MIKPEDIKPGQFIWWRADRMFKDWNCPGVIQSVNQESITMIVLTFDDYKTSELHIRGEAVRDEMRTATIDEIQDYAKNCEREQRRRLQKMNEDLTDMKEAIERSTKFWQEFWKECPVLTKE